jgi:RecB family endonuclease NucS
MRLVVARCEVVYTGRLSTALPEATRLVMFKDDAPSSSTTTPAATSP